MRKGPMTKQEKTGRKVKKKPERTDFTGGYLYHTDCNLSGYTTSLSECSGVVL